MGDFYPGGYRDQRELVHGPKNMIRNAAIPRNVPSGSWYRLAMAKRNPPTPPKPHLACPLSQRAFPSRGEENQNDAYANDSSE